MLALLFCRSVGQTLLFFATLAHPHATKAAVYPALFCGLLCGLKSLFLDLRVPIWVQKGLISGLRGLIWDLRGSIWGLKGLTWGQRGLIIGWRGLIWGRTSLIWGLQRLRRGLILLVWVLNRSPQGNRWSAIPLALLCMIVNWSESKQGSHPKGDKVL